MEVDGSGSASVSAKTLAMPACVMFTFSFSFSLHLLLLVLLFATGALPLTAVSISNPSMIMISFSPSSILFHFSFSPACLPAIYTFSFVSTPRTYTLDSLFLWILLLPPPHQLPYAVLYHHHLHTAATFHFHTPFLLHVSGATYSSLLFSGPRDWDGVSPTGHAPPPHFLTPLFWTTVLTTYHPHFYLPACLFPLGWFTHTRYLHLHTHITYHLHTCPHFSHSPPCLVCTIPVHVPGCVSPLHTVHGSGILPPHLQLVPAPAFSFVRPHHTPVPLPPPLPTALDHTYYFALYTFSLSALYTYLQTPPRYSAHCTAVTRTWRRGSFARTCHAHMQPALHCGRERCLLVRDSLPRFRFASYRDSPWCVSGFPCITFP